MLYGLRPSACGSGYATEATKAVLDYAFASLGLRRIVAGADAPNVKSFRVMERLRMQEFPDGIPSAPDAKYFFLENPRYVDA